MSDFLEKFLSPEARKRYNGNSSTSSRSYDNNLRRYSDLYLLGYSASEPESSRHHALEIGVEKYGLKKTVDHLHMCIKRSLSRSIPHTDAVNTWIRDIKWLREIYEGEHPDFVWPESYEGF